MAVTTTASSRSCCSTRARRLPHDGDRSRADGQLLRRHTANALGALASPPRLLVSGLAVAKVLRRLAPVPAQGSGGGESVAVEFQEVVGGGDRSPFRADRSASAASEAVQSARALHLREHGVDHRLALAVER